MEGRQTWSGTATELKQILRERFPGVTEDSHSFPRSAGGFGAALRRVEPELRRQGLALNHNRVGKAGVRIIVITNS